MCRRDRANAGSRSPYTTARRENVDVSGQTAYLKGTPPEFTPRFASTSSVSTLGSAHLNTAGEFVALGDQGYTSPTQKYADRTVTGGSW